MSGDLDDFARRLARLKPAAPDAGLTHRLEMALHRAEEERVAPTNIVAFPAFRWIAAAAALVVSFGLAFESTRGPGESGTYAAGGVTAPAQSEARPVYQVVDGRMVRVTNQEVMGRASYKGIRVIDGKAYRHFQHGSNAYWQPALDDAAPTGN
jgi:hypothetical protein